MPIPVEEIVSRVTRSRGKLHEENVRDVQNRFREKLTLDKVSRSRRKTKEMKHEKDPLVVPLRSLGKISLDKRPPPQKIPFLTESQEDTKDLKSWVDVKHLPTNAMKRKADPDDFSIWSDDEDEDGYVDFFAPISIGTIDMQAYAELVARKEDPDHLYYELNEGMRILADNYTTAALSYLRKKGHKLELVKTLLFNQGDIESGFRVHFNFKAKRADDPSSPVETFFCQLRDIDSKFIVECCVSLGRSDSLPYERDNRECNYCTEFVHHPAHCKGIIWGREVWSEKKKRIITT